MPSELRKTPKETKPRRSFRFRPAYLLLLVFMGLFAYTFLQKTHEIRGLAAQEASLTEANRQLRAANQHVQHQIDYYRTPQYIENTARADLSWALPNETTVQVALIQKKGPVVRAAPPPPPPLPPEPTWRQWWDVFSW